MKHQKNLDKKSYKEHYSNKYFDGWVENSLRSAEALIEILYQVYQPQSVADFGCGRGAWLATCEKFGSKILHGFDGPWVEKERLYSKNIEFFPSNFEEKIVLGRKYDLALSVEVAEHVSENGADNFVGMITQASDVVVFGAAAKGQGGENHINEQWQTYWIEKFRRNGYVCFDIFRSALWYSANVDWWYKQNTFLFVRESILKERFDVGVLRSMELTIYDIVHPESFAYRLDMLRMAQDGSMYNKLKEEIASQKACCRYLEAKMEFMKSSKFWKLRNQYMRIKKLLGF